MGNLTLASMKMSNSPGSVPAPWGFTLIGALFIFTVPVHVRSYDMKITFDETHVAAPSGSTM